MSVLRRMPHTSEAEHFADLLADARAIPQHALRAIPAQSTTPSAASPRRVAALRVPAETVSLAEAVADTLVST